MEIKQVIVVRTDLKMTKGKLAAQVAHAPLKLIIEQMSKIPLFDRYDSIIYNLITPSSGDIHQWLSSIYKKVVLRCDSEEELLRLLHQAQNENILCTLVTDIGLTQFNNIPTNTCIAIGPAKEDKIDSMTKHLKLL